MRFHSGVATVGLLKQSQDSLGLAGEALGTATLGTIKKLSTGLRFWAGTVKDPFFGNQNGLRELREAFAAGVLDLDAFQRHAGESPFGGIVASAIVLEVPNNLLPPCPATITSAGASTVPVAVDDRSSTRRSLSRAREEDIRIASWIQREPA